MKISEKGINIIKKFEGCKLTSYKCPAGVWTIGCGTIKYPNGNTVKKGDVCTDAQVDQYFSNDLVKFENSVNSLVKVPLTQNQFDALVSFSYNVGASNLATSTLLKKLNAKDYKGAAAEFPKWNKAGGKVMNGLTKRRNAEMELFLK
jgi:GH24 family phage-related lysozyme (muramidase)